VQVYKLREALGLYHFYILEVSLFQSVEITDFLPALKRSRVPFSKRFIVPLIDSELHLAYEGQSGGTEKHPHIFFSGPEILKLKGGPS
jgi:hypothetical protein